MSGRIPQKPATVDKFRSVAAMVNTAIELLPVLITSSVFDVAKTTTSRGNVSSVSSMGNLVMSARVVQTTQVTVRWWVTALLLVLSRRAARWMTLPLLLVPRLTVLEVIVLLPLPRTPRKQRDNPLPRDPGPDLSSSQDMVCPGSKLHRSQENVDVSHSDTGNESSDADNESDSTSRTIRTDDSHLAGNRVEFNKRRGEGGRNLSLLKIKSRRLRVNLTQNGGGAERKKASLSRHGGSLYYIVECKWAA